MDRFIANYNTEKGTTLTDLKSNMDRFIVDVFMYAIPYFSHLKSNMDRFIDNIDLNKPSISTIFKIQYG